MHITQTDPVYVRFNDLTEDEIDSLRHSLAYKNLSFQYMYLKAKKNVWAYRKNPDWHQYVEGLKAKIKQNAFLEDENGFYTYSGLVDFLRGRSQYKFSFEDKVKYPKFRNLPYALRYEPKIPYKHQVEAVDAFLQHKHAAIRLPTGSGKSTILENLIKQTGLSTLLMVPTTNIFDQMYEQMVAAFGKKYVGRYGAGKKEYKKHIVIGIGASLTNLEPGEEAYEALSKKEMFLIDEAHLVAADTLSRVGLGLTKSIPYRYSVSATPERGDGRDMLLEGLIGPVVYEKLYRELVKEGVLAQLEFVVFNCESEASYDGGNSKKNSQEHCLYNKNIIKMAALLSNAIVKSANENVLILIEEKEQLDYLKPFLNIPHDFAHAKSKKSQQVKDFNAGKITCLVGTSAVAVGSDFKGLLNLIFLMSGKSSTKVKQAIGRATRITPTKTKAIIYDFSVTNDKQSQRHFQERLKIYDEYSDEITFKGQFV